MAQTQLLKYQSKQKAIVPWFASYDYQVSNYTGFYDYDILNNISE